MLILSRTPFDQIVLDSPNFPEPITIEVLSVTGRQVKIGIDASDEVTILRGELCINKELYVTD